MEVLPALALSRSGSTVEAFASSQPTAGSRVAVSLAKLEGGKLKRL